MKPEKVATTTLPIFVCLILLPSIALTIVSFVIGGIDFEIECDNGAFVSLSTLLFAYAGTSVGYIVIVIIVIFVALGFLWTVENDKRAARVLFITFMVLAIVTCIIIIFNNFLWVIASFYVLFEQTYNCRDYSSWALTLTVAIYQSITLFVHIALIVIVAKISDK